MDGQLASAYRPGRGDTGPVWAALAAPLLALPEERRRAVLVLGLGGGSAARVVRELAPQALIVGVERDAEVLAAARAHFELDALGVEVHVADALGYLELERRRFDVVIEDCFVGPTRGIRKPDWLPMPGLGLAAARLRPHGLLVANTIHEASRVARHLLRRHPGVVAIGFRDFMNRVLAAGPGLDARRLRAAIAHHASLARFLPELEIRTLSGPRS